MHRVKAKVEAEKDKKQGVQPPKRAAPDEKAAAMGRPQQRRRLSTQRGGSGASALPASPTAISPLATSSASHAINANNNTTTGSPSSSFTPVGGNGSSFTPQSQTGSSPGGSELIYPFALGQHGIYTPFGNSPPLFPVSNQQQNVQLPSEMLEVSREEEVSGQFWQSLFGPPGSLLPPHQFSGQGFSQQQVPIMAAAAQNSTSPTRTTGEFRDPNDINVDMGGSAGDTSSSGLNLDEIDTGLVDWGEFIAQCSQVWVTE